VGTFAVQIARSFGADVTAVCSPRNVDTARSLGAHRVIDYTREDFTKSGELYDVLIDIAGSRSLLECRPVLKPDATFVLVGAAAVQHTSEMKAFGHIIGTRLRSVRGSQKVVFFIARLTRQDMEVIAGLMAAGKVTPVIDRRYRLDQVADAFAYFNEGHARGKIALDVTRSAPDGARANPQPEGVAVRPELKRGSTS
jgi:NADPH:quinone reductase-like Zn-dependent oxidoreductase